MTERRLRGLFPALRRILESFSSLRRRFALPVEKRPKSEGFFFGRLTLGRVVEILFGLARPRFGLLAGFTRQNAVLWRNAQIAALPPRA
jgi:hypothetical protein